MNNKKDKNQENLQADIKNKESEALDEVSNMADKESNKANNGKFESSELDKELQELASTFQTELDKAKSEDDVYREIFDDLGVVEESELCACCGERRRDKSFGENYEYCAECRESMKHYPFSFLTVLIAIVVTALSVFSIINFSSFFDGYYSAYKAEKSVKEKNLNTAIENFDNSITTFKKAGVDPNKLYLKSAVAVYRTMPMGVSSMSEVVGRIEEGISSVQSKMPIYGSYLDLRNQCIILQGTVQKFYSILEKEKYATFDKKDKKMYEEIMTEIGSLIDAQVDVPSIDGKKTKKYNADMAMVRFCQYMFAYTTGNFDDSYKYMREVEELRPDYTWLYAYELSFVETQKGNEKRARELSDRLKKVNKEAPDGYITEAYIERMTGNLDESIKAIDEGLKYSSENPELLRFKAIAYCVKGDYKEAKKLIDNAYDIEKYGMLCFTKIVIENELGNKDEVENLKKELEEQEVKPPQRMQDYLDGRLTAKKLFTEGTGDAE